MLRPWSAQIPADQSPRTMENWPFSLFFWKSGKISYHLRLDTKQKLVLFLAEGKAKVSCITGHGQATFKADQETIC